MKNTIARAASAALAAVLLAGSLAAQGITVHKYVALGDSYGAGYGAGCLVTREQNFSYPNQLATAFGISGFQQPTVSDPGIPTCNGITSLVPFSFGPISTSMGVPTNLTLARPYDNLSVPGFAIADITDTTSGGAADLILRGQGSALDQLLALNPDFVTLGIIGNDILGAGAYGFLLDGVTATPLPVFTEKYNAVAAALKASGRNGVFLSTPNVTFIPLASTLTRFVPDPLTGKPIIGPGGEPIPLLGPGDAAYPCPGGLPACPLPEGTLVTLGASASLDSLGGKSLLQLGFGIPCAVAPLPQCNMPLPVGSFTPPSTINVGVVLYPDVAAAINQRVLDMNSVISSAAAANGFKYFDFYAFSSNLIANGFTIGGVHITKNFGTGGMFAYGEAVHMSNIGYTILSDGIIQLINASYGTNFPRPDFTTALTTPDVPSGATPTSLTPAEESRLFDDKAWLRLFQEFPLQKSDLTIALPGADAAGGRAPVHPTSPRGRTTVDENRPPVQQ